MALNYQTDDKQNFLNRAKFSDNGGCGYVLKPGFLNEPDPNYSPCSPFILQVEKENTVKVTVVSGQHIPRPDGSLSGEVIDPYVEVRVRGHPDDKGNKEATEYVKNNGFNPVWNQTFQFNVKVPALAFLDFRVKDHSKSGKDQSLGAPCCVPRQTIQVQMIGGFFSLQAKQTQTVAEASNYYNAACVDRLDNIAFWGNLLQGAVGSQLQPHTFTRPPTNLISAGSYT